MRRAIKTIKPIIIIPNIAAIDLILVFSLSLDQKLTIKNKPIIIIKPIKIYLGILFFNLFT